MNGVKKWISENPLAWTLIIVAITFLFLTAPIAFGIAKVRELWAQHKASAPDATKAAAADGIAAKVKA